MNLHIIMRSYVCSASKYIKNNRLKRKTSSDHPSYNHRHDDVYSHEYASTIHILGDMMFVDSFIDERKFFWWKFKRKKMAGDVYCSSVCHFNQLFKKFFNV